MILTNMPELLSPAGSMESLYAAVNNGCDAVYLGGASFSAREYAKNFNLEEMEHACDYCHLRGVKVYVTVNTVYKEKEMMEVLRYVGKLYAMGVDALIMQDLGAASLIRKHYPDFPLHASTQLTANSLEDVNALYEQGFTRVVLSRELSLEEISYIAQSTQAGIETFIHGALCVCYSGQCIMSSMLGGRSGNRGRCAQTCRLQYSLYREFDKIKEAYLLSPKDIQTITILPELMEAGICSFKIEGRMKNPEYAAGVTAIYRKYMDMYAKDPEHYAVDQEDMKKLMQLFNRGGFSEGYYKNFAGSDMMCIERPKTWGLKTGFVDNYLPKQKRVTIRTREPFVPGDGIEIWTQNEPHVGTNITKASKAGEFISFTIEGNISKNDVVYKTYDKKLIDELKKTWEKHTRQKKVYAEVRAKVGEPIAMKLWHDAGNFAYVTGEVVDLAQNQPLSIEKLEQQLKKTGGTPFAIQHMDILADEGIYMTISSLNALRRTAVEALEEAILKKSKRVQPNPMPVIESKPSRNIKHKKITVLVSTKEQFDVVSAMEQVYRIYYEITEGMEKNLEQCIKVCQEKKIQLYAALPRIYRKHTQEIYADSLEKLKNSHVDGFLVRTPGQFAEFIKTGKKIAVDYTLNVLNQAGVSHWMELGADSVCISPELNLQEIGSMADEHCEMLGYGYLPLMVTQQCPVGNYAGGKNSGQFCSKKGNEDLYFLKDRKGMKFPLMTNCRECNCTILNSKPLFLLKFYNEILESPTSMVRLMFTKEGPNRTERIVKAYCEMTKDFDKKSLATKMLLEEMSEKGSTKGHYFRGVE